MTAMIRKQIYLKPRQEELLKRVAAETGHSEAELIRQALDSWSESVEEHRRALAAWGKARAFMEHRGYITPEDVRYIGADILRHRIILTYEAEAEEITTDDIVQRLLDTIEVP